MALSISPTQSDVQAAFKSFLSSVLPSDVEVRAGTANKVPEPKGSRFVVMNLLQWPRLATNLDTYQDVLFVGAIAAAVLTVTELDQGTILIGSNIFGANIPDGVTIINQTSGTTGGLGTYTISQSLTVSSQVIAAGGYTLQQNGDAIFQLDVHAADNTASDLAQIISTSFRDELATSFFSALTAPGNLVSPLYADDPKFHPFFNGEDQMEWAFYLEAHLQVNQSVRAPLQFASSLNLSLYNVDFPPP